MRSYHLLRQLIDLLERFDQGQPEKAVSLSDFAAFLLSDLQRQNTVATGTEVRFGQVEFPAQEIAFQLDNNISRLVIFMNRYARHYLKKALEGTPLRTPEEFTALAILLTHEHLTKSELIEKNIQEKTSGTEVIRRLIASGLIIESAHASDRRSKRIAISETGRALLYRIFQHTSDVGKVVTGKLTFAEKLVLQHLLQKLEDFHHPIHQDRVVSDRDDLHKLASGL
ncbi:MarR family winged helix-turn-helix transcriptional regulator [Mucilaginibacter myungsuensis]|uniref:Winged helix-turn-helix transcriptional regulator n=1 Tax=Mucilaginibacter myungsuensis TaxID=649104 RepID=A0A929KWI8_9SPHI|nr:MarR family winged helix-turn-helix transcriptional regulator [Mucilaginibacter myungsuensis]MBE9662936.1 winged helix-turn-helix transcriptional regulator [Mucilaginibacter myungsuensis]MDN3598557.1 MarR family winged helix-turn-helix transcriptional regulator [Mucilaginibacter myungsuensis]